MKRILLVSAVLILSLSCWHSKDYDVDLSTLEKTLRSYYEGFKRSDFEYQKKTVVSWTEPIARETFNVVSPILKSYEIVEWREAKDRKNDTFQLPEDDIQAIVKEIDKNNQESENSFILRKFNGKWLIIGFDVVEDPPGSKVIDEQAKKIPERKGKK